MVATISTRRTENLYSAPDAFRSLVFILLAGAVIWAWVIQKLKVTQVAIIMGLLVLADMWTVDKRYLNQ